MYFHQLRIKTERKWKNGRTRRKRPFSEEVWCEGAAWDLDTLSAMATFYVLLPKVHEASIRVQAIFLHISTMHEKS
jgi:hypothetical protein